jgi:predicted DNA-binding transcriptional regulator YafY
MSMNERIYRIDQLLSERRVVTIPLLLEKLGVSKATLKRDLALMRDRLNAPIIFDRELGGYRFEQPGASSNLKYELPGLWFSAREIHALLTMHHLITGLNPKGLLGHHVQPLLTRVSALLGSANNTVAEVQKRIKIEMPNARPVELEYFETIGSALLSRKRLLIDHYSRGKNTLTQREISPQRMVYYKGNWYLDAWCHTRNDLRVFSVDAIRRAEILEAKARNVPEKQLNEVLGSGYGIFAGKDVQWAKMIFDADSARWVANELWHPKQRGKLLKDGRYQLEVPYSAPRELMMEILGYGSRLQVISPPSLVAEVAMEIAKMGKTYHTGPAS